MADALLALSARTARAVDGDAICILKVSVNFVFVNIYEMGIYVTVWTREIQI